MFKLFIEADTLKFDYFRFTKRMKEVVRIRMRVAARAFVRAAVQSGLVPIDTGMARGTFLNIGRLLRVAIPSGGGRTGAIYYDHGTKLPKTPEAGAALATPDSEIFSEEGEVFTFFYGNDVIHYNINDFFPRIAGAPWGSYEAGREAFFQSFTEGLRDKFPNIKSAMLVSTLVGGPNGITRRERRLRPEEPLQE